MDANFVYVCLLVLFLVQGWLLGGRLMGRSGEAVVSERRTTQLVICAVLLGAALRLYGVDFGLPDGYHPDEMRKTHILRRMMRSGTIDPNFNLHPPLLLYCSWLMTNILSLLGIFTEDGMVRAVLGGRLVSVFAGTASIYLVYAIGRRISSARAGVVAAFLLAVFPLHVTSSRYMKEDALFVMFVLGAVLGVLKSVDEKKLRYLYAAGLSAGFAFGTKYTGILTPCILLAAPFLNHDKFSFVPDRKIAGHALAACLLIPVGFLISAPYVAFSRESLDGVIGGFRWESHHAMSGHMGRQISAASQLWMFHFRRSLIPGISALPMAAALIAAGMFLRNRNPRGLYLIALVLLFYLPAEWAQSKPPPQPDRYVFPCTPFLALLAAELIGVISTELRTHRNVGALLAALVIIFPLTRSTLYASEVRNDTRRKMTDWMSRSLAPGSKIVLVGGKAYLSRVPLKFRARELRKVIGGADEDLTSKLRESGYDYLLTSRINDDRFKVDDDRPRRGSSLEEVEESLALVQRFTPRWGSYGFHNPTLSLYRLK